MLENGTPLEDIYGIIRGVEGMGQTIAYSAFKGVP